MSDFRNGMASNVGRATGAVLSGADDIKDQVSEVASRAKSSFDSARKPVAAKLNDAAHRVRKHADRISGVAESAADKLEASADYIKSRDARRMAHDLMGVIKRHPTKSLLIAGALGYLIARAFRSKD